MLYMCYIYIYIYLLHIFPILNLHLVLGRPPGHGGSYHLDLHWEEGQAGSLPVLSAHGGCLLLLGVVSYEGLYLALSLAFSLTGPS